MSAQQQITQYLQQHRIQEILDVVFEKLCELQPPDPMGFLASQFSQLRPPPHSVINIMPLKCFLEDLKKDNLELDSTLSVVRNLAPPTVDLGDPIHEGVAHDLADLILRLFPLKPPAATSSASSAIALASASLSPLASLEAFLEEIRGRHEPAILKLALFLAISKRVVHCLHTPCKITVVIPLFTQHLRILPKEENPEGEDFLRRKIKQLEWLCMGSKAVWNILLVDDGCKLGSADLARKICGETALKDKCSVYTLAEGVVQDSIVKGLNVEDSVLGMAVQFGLWTAANRPFRGDHIVTFCNPHFSIHLGQAGFLIDAIVNRQQPAHVCSPYHPKSVYFPTPPTAILKDQLERKTDPENERLSVFLARALLKGTGLEANPGFCTGVGLEVAAQFVNGSFGCVQGLVGFTAAAALKILKGPLVNRKEAFDIELVVRAVQQEEAKTGDGKFGISYGPLFVAKVDNEYATMKLSNVKGLVDSGNMEKPFARTLRLLQAIAQIAGRTSIATWEMTYWEKLVTALPSCVPPLPSSPAEEAELDDTPVLFVLLALETQLKR